MLFSFLSAVALTAAVMSSRDSYRASSSFLVFGTVRKPPTERPPRIAKLLPQLVLSVSGSAEFVNGADIRLIAAGHKSACAAMITARGLKPCLWLARYK